MGLLDSILGGGGAGGLAGLVDKLTPDGQIPQPDSLEKMLGAFNIGK